MSTARLDSSSYPNQLTLISSSAGGWGLFNCVCGWRGEKRIKDVKRGAIRSCGCLRRRLVGLRSRSHGHTLERRVSPTLSVWRAMIARTRNPNNKRYFQYGGRGISVCRRWTCFENFLADMGNRPRGKTLDRKNNNKGYSPSNCRWATPKEQVYNRSVTLRFVWKGQTFLTPDLAKMAGLPESLVRERYRAGWSVEKIIKTPHRVTRVW